MYSCCIETGRRVCPGNYCSDWASPCLLVGKPERSVVSSVTKSYCFLLPWLEDCVDRVGSAKFVTKLDLLRGYWQMPLTQRAQEISSFVTPSEANLVVNLAKCDFAQATVTYFVTLVKWSEMVRFN